MPHKDNHQIYRHPRERKGDPGSQYGAGFKGHDYHKERGVEDEASAGYRDRETYSPGEAGMMPEGPGETGGEEEKKNPAPRKKPRKN